MVNIRHSVYDDLIYFPLPPTYFFCLWSCFISPFTIYLKLYKNLTLFLHYFGFLFPFLGRLIMAKSISRILFSNSLPFPNTLRCLNNLLKIRTIEPYLCTGATPISLKHVFYSSQKTDDVADKFEQNPFFEKYKQKIQQMHE